MKHRVLTAAAILLSVGFMFLGACSSPPTTTAAGQDTPPPGPSSPSAAKPATLTELALARPAGPFDAQILEIARTYQQRFVRVSDRTRWATPLCVAVPINIPLESVSKDTGTHGRKLYFLFAKDAYDYQERAARPAVPPGPNERPYQAPVGQALVKQSFTPIPIPKSEPTSLFFIGAPDSDSPSELPAVTPAEYAADDSGVLHHTGTPAELFIMLKTDPATPGTDQGWVYATTTSDGKTILDAGRIGSCMGCHKENTQDRQFGPRRAWPGQSASPKP